MHSGLLHLGVPARIPALRKAFARDLAVGPFATTPRSFLACGVFAAVPNARSRPAREPVHQHHAFTERKIDTFVKMKEADIIHALLANPLVQRQFNPRWKAIGKGGADGSITLTLNGKAHTFLVEVKRDIRSHMLPRLKAHLATYKDGLLVAAHLTPAIRKQLQMEGLNYLEANGNCDIRKGAVYMHIEGRTPLRLEEGKRQRAFTKAGLRVVFNLLIDPQANKATLTTLARRSGTSIGNVSIVLQDLAKAGLLMKKGTRDLLIPDRTALLNKWTDAYSERLKPGLARGRYRFARTEQGIDWKSLKIDTTTTCWGGEAAGALLTKYLHPGQLILFTTASQLKLIKDYKLVPDELGNLFVYERFWDHPESNPLHGRCCPPVLAYADLIHSRDSRCVETAQRLFDEHIRSTL